MRENEVFQDDEISLYDLLERLRNGWKLISGGGVLGVLAAAAAVAVIPHKYQAMAVVQVGQVGQIKVTGLPVEPPTISVERIKAPAFQRRVAERLNDQEWLQAIDSSTAEGAKGLSLQIIKGTVGPEQIPLIELRIDAESSGAAKRKLEAVVAELVKVHAELAQPALDRMRADLAISREKLLSAERDLVALNKLVTAAGVKDDRFTQFALMTSLRIKKESETFGQRQMISALESALNAPTTLPARAIEAVFVPEKPVSPKKGLLFALGALGGLFLGVVLVCFRAAWKRTIMERAERVASV